MPESKRDDSEPLVEKGYGDSFETRRSRHGRDQGRLVRLNKVGLTVALIAALVGSAPSVPATAAAHRSGWDLVGDTGRTTPPRFVAYRLVGNEHSGGRDGLALNRTSDGSLVRWLLGPSHHDMALDSVALDPDGLLVSYRSGPACTSGVAGCGPKDGTCSSEIDRYDVHADTFTRLVKADSTSLVGNARLSPDGRYLAYAESPCVPSYFNDHLRILDLHTWSSWTIGADLPRCHSLGLQGWALDSAHLLVDYAPARGPDYHGADGICPESGRQHLKVIDALSGQPGVRGVSEPTHPGCELESAAPAGRGVLAVEACGKDDYLDGRVRLVRFGPQLHRIGRVFLGRCTDGNELTANRAGTRWLVSAYLYCGDPADPKTKVWTYNGRHLRHVTTQVGGDLTYSSLAW